MFDVTDVGAVRRLTISNPGRKNAIPAAGWPELARLLEEFGTSERRALVITGAGGDFCSGADLSPNELLGESGVMDHYHRMATVGRAALALHRLAKPTVAAVEGVAVGAGMNLALGCDVVVASRTARFAEIFVRRGLTVDFGGTWLLPRMVGMAVARDLALTGRFVDGEEAHRIGLASRLVEPADLMAASLEVAAELAAGAPLAQRFIKRGLDRSLDMTFEEALAYEDQAQAICLSSADVAEGVAAFAERREPEFEGR